MSVERLSFNQVTFDSWTLEECVRACERQGIRTLAPWRHKIRSAADTHALLRNEGLGVSSLCRGGFFSASTPEERRRKLDDNRRAIEEAAAIGAPLLVLVCGPAEGQSLDDARMYAIEAIAELVTDAQEANVKLGIEPLHPMFAADRSVVVSLAQANDMVTSIAHNAVGVVIDVFHVWWDPQVYREIARAGKSILGFHVSDWAVPLPGILMGRSLMGDGVIELRRLRQAVDATGYAGPIEVEIFNEEVWKNASDGMLGTICRRFEEHVL